VSLLLFLFSRKDTASKEKLIRGGSGKTFDREMAYNIMLSIVVVSQMENTC